MVVAAVRRSLEENGWKVSSQFPSPWTYFKGGRQINLTEKHMKLFTDKHLDTIDNMEYLNGSDKLAMWFIKT